MKFLIVEDDTALNNGIALSFDKENALQAYSVSEALSLFDETVEFIILDINLPDGSGLDLCRQIRRTSQVPIIMLTANDMELDIVSGLESGADDYVTKPLSPAVLRARVNAVLRRKSSSKTSTVYSDGDFVFDFDNMIFTVKGKQAELSKQEQRLLRLLVQNRGTTLSKNTLIDCIWSDEAQFVEENALSVTVKRLREKLTDAPIKTVYGIGYVWEK